MVEEWYREADNHAKAKALFRAEVEKSLGAIKQKQLELSEKLKSADQVRFSTEAGLKTAERHAEEQHQKLHSIEIDLAMQKKMVIDLQAELKRAKEELQLAKKEAEVEKNASY